MYAQAYVPTPADAYIHTHTCMGFNVVLGRVERPILNLLHAEEEAAKARSDGQLHAENEVHLAQERCMSVYVQKGRVAGAGEGGGSAGAGGGGQPGCVRVGERACA
jgi:hypothetical protein